jgi:hypothetical protein
MIHTHLVALLVAYLLVCLGYALFSLKTTRSRLFRGISLLYLGSSIGVSLYLYNQLLSLPKPIDQEFFIAAKEATVLGVKVSGGNGIYLWLQLPERDQPAYYVMPWNGRAAEDLEIAQREAREHGGSVVMNAPFENNQMHGLRADRDEQLFSAAIAARPPLKNAELGSGSTAYQFDPTRR